MVLHVSENTGRNLNVTYTYLTWNEFLSHMKKGDLASTLASCVHPHYQMYKSGKLKRENMMSNAYHLRYKYLNSNRGLIL